MYANASNRLYYSIKYTYTYIYICIYLLLYHIIYFIQITLNYFMSKYYKLN